MLLETRNLTYIYSQGTTYEKTAVNDVSMHIGKGEFIGIIGHTGSGKSTLIQHFNALLCPTSGFIFLDGEDINEDKQKLPAVRQKVGLVFQYPEYQLFEISVAKDVAYGLKNLGLTEAETNRRVSEALEAVGLPESAYGKSPFELSGGEKRRAAIAGVLVTSPRILVLDEPAAGLDPRGRHGILTQIKKMHGDSAGGLSVILVSHSMEDIARYADRIYVMENGRIALTGTPREIFTNAADKLCEIGLALPMVTQLIRGLNEEGFGLDPGIFTAAEAYEAIKKSLAEN